MIAKNFQTNCRSFYKERKVFWITTFAVILAHTAFLPNVISQMLEIITHGFIIFSIISSVYLSKIEVLLLSVIIDSVSGELIGVSTLQYLLIYTATFKYHKTLNHYKLQGRPILYCFGLAIGYLATYSICSFHHVKMHISLYEIVMLLLLYKVFDETSPKPIDKQKTPPS